MIRRLTLTVAAAAAIALATPGTAQADTLCNDGWLSPSNGGSGTCSWHGGIFGNNRSSSGGGGGGYYYSNSYDDDDDGGDATGVIVFGVLAAIGIWLYNQDDPKR
jgi:hypothetical protein